MFFIIASIFTARRVCTVRTMPQHSTAQQDVCPSVRLSVRLSVSHTPVLRLNGYTYPQSFLTIG